MICRRANSGTALRSYQCAICRRDVEYAGRLPELYPFCSYRCQMVDLGKWLTEQYTIECDVAPEDLPEDPGPAGGTGTA